MPFAESLGPPTTLHVAPSGGPNEDLVVQWFSQISLQPEGRVRFLDLLRQIYPHLTYPSPACFSLRWPQSSKTSPWNSYVKDALERKLHNLVCADKLDLKTAQREIASNWIEAYKKYVGKSPPAPMVQETKTGPANSTANEVWVNPRSGKYWKPGSRFYGKTKQGEFMPESGALDRGYSPAGGTGP
jgi:hypothetical protein